MWLKRMSQSLNLAGSLSKIINIGWRPQIMNTKCARASIFLVVQTDTERTIVFNSELEDIDGKLSNPTCV